MDNSEAVEDKELNITNEILGEIRMLIACKEAVQDNFDFRNESEYNKAAIAVYNRISERAQYFHSIGYRVIQPEVKT